MILVTFFCDSCGKREEGPIDHAPPGWVVSRWVPGILQPPGKPRRSERDRHLCSAPCLEAHKMDYAARSAVLDAMEMGNAIIDFHGVQGILRLHRGGPGVAPARPGDHPVPEPVGWVWEPKVGDPVEVSDPAEFLSQKFAEGAKLEAEGGEIRRTK